MTIFIKSGVAQLVSGEGDAEAPVADWQVPRIIEDPDQWSAMEKPRYRLRLTDKGYEQFVRDSERFFDELFAARGAARRRTT